ncbi:MAG: DinB family protein [Candidatus Acidiferrum sp.]
MNRNFASFAVAATLGVTVFCAGSVRAQELTQAEKDKALQYLESTKKDVLDATKGLSEAKWNFKAAPDRWSIAECMEHIASAEDFIRDNISNGVMKAPAVPGRDVAKIDAGIMENVPERKTKVQAPEPLKPSNRFGSPEGSIKHFVESRSTTEEFLKNTEGLRDHAVDSPVGGKWDGYEFVLLIAAHSERHTNQIKEVKADPNFPKQ